MSATAYGEDTIVQIWESGRLEDQGDRALTILSLLSGRPRTELAELSVEARDTELFAWRGRLFGATLAGYSACPRCGCGVDVSLAAAGLGPADDAPFVVNVGDTSLLVRMPTSLDLAAAGVCGSVEEARLTLVRRCVSGGAGGDGLRNGDENLAGANLAAAAIEAIEAEMHRRAPLSEGVVSLACPDCGHGWSLELDISRFLWAEIEIFAARLLRDVDVLARRYGWSERDILGLSNARRRFYLELAS